MIRLLQPEDLEQACALLEILRLHTPYRALLPDWERIINTLIMSQGIQGQVWVADNKGKITGILIAAVSNIWWTDPRVGPCIASDLVFYSQRFGDGRRMLQAMVDWAFQVPRVVRIEMAVSSAQADLSTMQRVYESVGFKLEGSLFIRNHPKYDAVLNGQ